MKSVFYLKVEIQCSLCYGLQEKRIGLYIFSTAEISRAKRKMHVNWILFPIYKLLLRSFFLLTFFAQSMTLNSLMVRSQ